MYQLTILSFLLLAIATIQGMDPQSSNTTQFAKEIDTLIGDILLDRKQESDLEDYLDKEIEHVPTIINYASKKRTDRTAELEQKRGISYRCGHTPSCHFNSIYYKEVREHHKSAHHCHTRDCEGNCLKRHNLYEALRYRLGKINQNGNQNKKRKKCVTYSSSKQNKPYSQRSELWDLDEVNPQRERTCFFDDLLMRSLDIIIQEFVDQNRLSTQVNQK
jgi:hypothetical protein